AMIYGKSDRPIEVSASREDSILVISVADRGAGFGPGEETKVFQKFYRGPRTRPGGLGLGLSIARQLIEANGGQIVAQNRHGGGAVFSIRLPVSKAMQLPGTEPVPTGVSPEETAEAEVSSVTAAARVSSHK